MGTSTLASLAELKMHIRGEHQEKSTKIRMKHLFDHRSKSTLPDALPVSELAPPDPEPAVEFSTSLPSETSAPGLHHLIPDDVASDEPTPTGTEDPIPLKDLFNFSNGRWVDLYNEHARKYLAEELALCELLSRDAATNGGAEVDVDEMTSEILMT